MSVLTRKLHIPTELQAHQKRLMKRILRRYGYPPDCQTKFGEGFEAVEGKCPETAVHRQVKYLNNVIEADHGKLKQLIRPVRGFKTLKTSYAMIAGLR